MWASPSDQLSVYPQQRWSHRSQQLICPPNNSSPHPIPEGPMWYTHHFLTLSAHPILLMCQAPTYANGLWISY